MFTLICGVFHMTFSPVFYISPSLLLLIIISWISNATINNHRYSLQPFSGLPSFSSSFRSSSMFHSSRISYLGTVNSYGTKVECFRSTIAHSSTHTLEPFIVTSSLVVTDLSFALSNRFDDDDLMMKKKPRDIRRLKERKKQRATHHNKQ